MHPYLVELIATERVRDLSRESSRPPRAALPSGRAAILVRIAEAGDRPAVERLAELEERRLPDGPLLVAEVDGDLAAALPLAGGPPVTDPFRPSRDALGLLELRARQLAAA